MENKPQEEGVKKGEMGNAQEVEKPLSVLEQSQKAVAALKEQNDRLEQNLARVEELRANELLSGSAPAGMEPDKPKEESPQDYAKRVLAGGI